MECKKCKAIIPDGDEREYQKEVLCENCYIDALSPTKFCDPWAEFNAQSFVKNNPKTAITDNQRIIIRILEETGETIPEALMVRLQSHVSTDDIKRDCAALHRMGKISIENKNGVVCISLK